MTGGFVVTATPAGSGCPDQLYVGKMPAGMGSDWWSADAGSVVWAFASVFESEREAHAAADVAARAGIPYPEVLPFELAAEWELEA